MCRAWRERRPQTFPVELGFRWGRPASDGCNGGLGLRVQTHGVKVGGRGAYPGLGFLERPHLGSNFSANTCGAGPRGEVSTQTDDGLCKGSPFFIFKHLFESVCAWWAAWTGRESPSSRPRRECGAGCGTPSCDPETRSRESDRESDPQPLPHPVAPSPVQLSLRGSDVTADGSHTSLPCSLPRLPPPLHFG